MFSIYPTEKANIHGLSVTIKEEEMYSSTMDYN